MEFCWFAICTILAFIPWISAEEKLLYQTRNENRWGSWDVITNGLSSLNVIKLVFWVSAEEKLLYQTPNENRWGGWDATTNSGASLNVIKLVLCCFIQYPDHKHPICKRAAFL